MLVELCHEGLNGFHIGFTLLDTTGNALMVTKTEVLVNSINYIFICSYVGDSPSSGLVCSGYSPLDHLETKQALGGLAQAVASSCPSHLSPVQAPCPAKCCEAGCTTESPE